MLRLRHREQPLTTADDARDQPTARAIPRGWLRLMGERFGLDLNSRHAVTGALHVGNRRSDSFFQRVGLAVEVDQEDAFRRAGSPVIAAGLEERTQALRADVLLLVRAAVHGPTDISCMVLRTLRGRVDRPAAALAVALGAEQQPPDMSSRP